MLVASPLEGIARRVKDALTRRRRNIELSEIHLEEARTQLALSRILRPDFNCVDVGCHIGSFLSTILRLCPEGSHTAIEASADKARWLRAKFPNVVVHDVAVSDQIGCAEFFEDERRPGFSRLHKPPSAYSRSTRVSTITLDQLLGLNDRINFIKIDIEGAELSALRGARTTIAKHGPDVYFECGSNHDLAQLSVSRKDLFDLLTTELGYSIYTLPDFLFDKGPLSFDEFRKCGIYPFRAFNFLALKQPSQAT